MSIVPFNAQKSALEVRALIFKVASTCSVVNWIAPRRSSSRHWPYAVVQDCGSASLV
jgi:hypothetical protein